MRDIRRQTRSPLLMSPLFNAAIPGLCVATLWKDVPSKKRPGSTIVLPHASLDTEGITEGSRAVEGA